LLSGKFRSPALLAPGYTLSISPIASDSPAFFTSRPSSASTPASSCALMSTTISFTGLDFSMISPTAPIASSSPLLIRRSATIVETRKYTSASTISTTAMIISTAGPDIA
jgi:hypothetical protein